jgi:anti-sigma B factor antagonist
MQTYILTNREGVIVLQLQTNSLDALTVPDVRLVVDQLVDQGGIKVVVDMQAVQLIDSSGIGVVVSLFKRLRALGGAVRVAAVRHQPYEIFRLMSLDRVLAVYATTEDALRDF